MFLRCELPQRIAPHDTKHHSKGIVKQSSFQFIPVGLPSPASEMEEQIEGCSGRESSGCCGLDSFSYSLTVFSLLFLDRKEV